MAGVRGDLRDDFEVPEVGESSWRLASTAAGRVQSNIQMLGQAAGEAPNELTS